MPPQVTSPIAIPSTRKSLHVVTSQELIDSLSAMSADNYLVRSIRENDYTVPAPPPPSPVSFRMTPEQWQKAARR